MAKITARPSPSDTSSAPLDARTNNPRFTMPLTDKGGIDWDRMRSDNRDKLQELLRDAPFTTPAAAPAAAAFTIPPAVIDALYDALGSVESLAVLRITRCTPDQAALFRYSAAEKGMLQAPTVRVLDKYSGPALQKYADEIALAAILATTFANKVALLKDAIGKPSAQVISIVNRESEQSEP